MIKDVGENSKRNEISREKRNQKCQIRAATHSSATRSFSSAASAASQRTRCLLSIAPKQSQRCGRYAFQSCGPHSAPRRAVQRRPAHCLVRDNHTATPSVMPCNYSLDRSCRSLFLLLTYIHIYLHASTLVRCENLDVLSWCPVHLSCVQFTWNPWLSLTGSGLKFTWTSGKLLPCSIFYAWHMRTLVLMSQHLCAWENMQLTLLEEWKLYLWLISISELRVYLSSW